MARQAKNTESVQVETETTEAVVDETLVLETSAEEEVADIVNEAVEEIEEGAEIQDDSIEEVAEEEVHAVEETIENATEEETAVSSVEDSDKNDDEGKGENVDTEECNTEFPYQKVLKVPTIIYRGAHPSLGEKRFCGVVTVLAPADANGFAPVKFMRPGVGLSRGYILL